MTQERFIAEISAHEMACRILEAITAKERYPDMTAEENMHLVKKFDPSLHAACYRAAGAAGRYIEEAVNDYKRVQ